MIKDKNDVFLTKKEVADLLKVTICTVDNYSRSGILKPLGIGRRVLFRKTDVINSIVEL